MSPSGAVLLFPGQGSQAPGMGRELIQRGLGEDLLELAAEAGVELRRLLTEAGAEELRATELAQPALYFTGVCLWRLLAAAGLEPLAAAGHSLGEYCAVVAAGSISAESGMRLVLERGRLMAAAPEGTMAAVLGLDREPLQRLCEEVEAGGECCVVANDNAPGQLVVSGSGPGVARLSELARARGARKVVPLQVGGAFHSPLMAEPAAAFARVLGEVEIGDPAFPVGSGVEGQLSRTAEQVRRGLVRQLNGPVRWTEVQLALAQLSPTALLELGPGSTLSGLAKRILPGSAPLALGSPEAVDSWLASTSDPAGGRPAPRLQ